MSSKNFQLNDKVRLRFNRIKTIIENNYVFLGNGVNFNMHYLKDLQVLVNSYVSSVPLEGVIKKLGALDFYGIQFKNKFGKLDMSFYNSSELVKLYTKKGIK